MLVDDFDFELPEELIALRPVHPRSSSKLLLAQGTQITDKHVYDLPDILNENDILVFNDTKVIPARLFGERRRKTIDTSPNAGIAKIEVTLIERLGPDSWRALAKPGRKLREGDDLYFEGELRATLTRKEDAGEVTLQFDRASAELDAAIAAAGVMPLPPYIAGRRAADDQDNEDYQTVFAKNEGAVAAPTASLHFDEELLTQLAIKGVRNTRVTLHVGAGTFLPVKVDKVEDHKMHSEWGMVSEAAVADIAKAKAAGGRVIPVGTTALRLIESAAASGTLEAWSGDTDIFITPGYKWRVADGLMTNFHLPKSTLMMLVSAMLGMDEIRNVYKHAIENHYRFYSYGDSSLLLPNR